MLDRSQAPKIHSVRNITIPEIETYPLSGGRNLYVHREPNISAFKIELLTDGGNINGKNAAEVQLGLKILGEGTKKKNALQLSEYIDSLGSFFELSPGFDHSSISIYGLKKYFRENLEILSDIIYNPRISNQSLSLTKEKEKNKLKLNLEKGSYISSVNLRTSLFGNHPYGYKFSLEDIDRIISEDLALFHSNYLLSFDIYISGDIPEEYISQINDYFPLIHKTKHALIPLEGNTPENLNHKDSKFIQSSIKLGKRLFNRSHPDYFKFIVTNELLGGFFGSRLMKNIREDKGYTYGIYSALYPLNEIGYFLISTDVKGENEADTLKEIKDELTKLSSKLVTEDELKTVKNYMVGSFVNSFSAPFAPITKFKTVNSQELSLDFYTNYIKRINSVNTKDIIEICSNYLNYDSLSISIAGA